ncbi:MAG: hypothetical protein OXD30_08385, partial [Bryobacterales bacterium]|nr:hypothetical protein [Bryobacterales bacterium]
CSQLIYFQSFRGFCRRHYIREIKLLLVDEWSEPTEDFAKYLAGCVYDRPRTKPVIEQFQRITRVALKQFLSERINDRLKSALDEGESETSTEVIPSEELPDQELDSGIVTTEEEWQAFYAVKAIASQQVPSSRVEIRDALTLCNVLLDGSLRKRICQFRFNKSQKYIGLFDIDPMELVPIDSIDDIFSYADRIKAAIQLIDGSTN